MNNNSPNSPNSPNSSNSQNEPSIFAINKNEDKNDEDDRIIFSYDDIMKSIPKNSFNKPNIKLLKTMTERRWRFFKYGDRKLVEISKKEPMKDRLYIDIYGKWIHYSVPDIWDKYLISEKYYYV
jgi:uncharacterized protein (DUF1499 family)